ncbi:MAG: DNA/RNA non-specific endonuclease [Bacteroidales bacterium]|nr:DNA/RNA non-specific endonuclease [Bacteroidales bacterium]MBN2764160.1 DNA/RNA non-specific endonuclease [Bacteroidales bacterium]
MKTRFIIAMFFSCAALPAQEAYEIASPMPRELPVKHSYFTLSYNEGNELASWAAYALTPEMAKAEGTVKEKYNDDPLVSTNSSSKKDYKTGGFVMAQLVPAEDMLLDLNKASETYYMSNIVPQKIGFNKYLWKGLEQLVNAWAKEGNTLYITAGPVLADGPFGTFGDNKVAIPLRYYKVILDLNGERAVGFIFRNNTSSGTIQSYAVSVDEVEKNTGIDFFMNVHDELEEKLESTLDLSKWNFEVLKQ